MWDKQAQNDNTITNARSLNISQMFILSPAVYVAVPSWNPTLFHCVYQLHYCIQSAVAQISHSGWESYMLQYAWIPDSSMQRMSPALNKSTALRYFECGNGIEIRNAIMFNFYLGLPHTILSRASAHTRTSTHPPILTVLWLLRVTTHNAKFLCSESEGRFTELT